MAKSCVLTGKKTTTGFHVSHSNVHVKRKLKPNLQKRRLLNPRSGRTVTVVISTSGLRTLKKWDREGKKYDLAEIKKVAAM
ncbi:MAG: 50S ribosomal protein L28 [Patescibacteria group bacterium]